MHAGKGDGEEKGRATLSYTTSTLREEAAH